MAVAGASPEVGTVPRHSPCPGRLAEAALAAGGLQGLGALSQSLSPGTVASHLRLDAQPCSRGGSRGQLRPRPAGGTLEPPTLFLGG